MSNFMIKNLTEEQILFLQYHGISLDLLFDVSGMTNSEFKIKMGRLGKKVAFNARPCLSIGHTLKDRYGHCIQCDTKHVSFIKRAKGYTYLACSMRGKLVKIGYTENVSSREESLIRTSYGGEKDWKILYSFFSEKAAKIEREAHKELSKFQIFREYSHDGYYHYASEMFTCKTSFAKNILERKIKELGEKISHITFNERVSDQFDLSLNS
ncbi:GIY-YIG nuclease family protein [Algoriphagus persicinus]|uniref:GIY-YIG nuclease family protein n=1 Tax=Algoriphagus persicinus TaxID=3108754 RepID=UPI002B3D1749|nr:GIY-YIG nuclease family protein [Algoriphagus sp. E1-3-M2]MEB2786514.1 GIY-YIG nuclease family protein [Algoriphagus sp. E1-3-M2]